MSRHLRHDLERLEKKLLMLGGLVEEAVRRSTTAFLEHRHELAEQVIQGDANIDREEVEIEDECLKVLALHQPVATDLRFIAACLKINNDLERIGDLAINIAKRATSISQTEPAAMPGHLGDMMESATRMLREALDSFVRADVSLARGVLEADEVVDRHNRENIGELLQLMKEDPQVIENALLHFSVSKYLERIADHATNIAEDVVYMVEGEIIRHQGDAATRD